MQTFELSADNQLDGLSSLNSAVHSIHGSHKDFLILVHLTPEQFSIFASDHFRRALTQRKMVDHVRMVVSGSVPGPMQ